MTKPSLTLGHTKAGEPYTTTARDRTTHTHVVGLSGKGKSKFIESLVRQDITDPNEPGVMVMDPHGALYDAKAPTHDASNPVGQWNQLVLECCGTQITVVINDQQVLKADLNSWTKAGENPDGSTNKFRTALKDLPNHGRIGLQNHGKQVWFREIKVEELNGCRSSAKP